MTKTYRAANIYLRKIGIKADSAGYFQLVKALEIMVQHEGFPMATKEIYPAVARATRSSASAVERNIRSLLARSGIDMSNKHFIYDSVYHMELIMEDLENEC